VGFDLTMPVLVQPVFSIAATVSLALPLFIVTMASQNLPGVAAIQASGFGDQRSTGGDAGIPISKVITLTGIATLLLAPFGAGGTHRPERRLPSTWCTGRSAGSDYRCARPPKELVAAIAGWNRTARRRSSPFWSR
jgi:benzoate membrane transport protein